MQYLKHNTFGVEIEFAYLPLRQAAKEIRKLKLRDRVRFSDGYRRSNGTFWDVKTDASITMNFENEKYVYESCGGEIASPKLTPSKRSFEELQRVMQTLVDSGAKFNRECGLHVHVDITGVDKFKLLMTILRYENELYKGFAKSRRTNPYIKPLKRLTDDQISKKLNVKLGEMIKDKTLSKLIVGDHHSAFVFYDRKGIPMVEMRMGQATKDVDKSLNWIKFVLSKVREARDLDILESMYT